MVKRFGTTLFINPLGLSILFIAISIVTGNTIKSNFSWEPSHPHRRCVDVLETPTIQKQSELILIEDVSYLWIYCCLMVCFSTLTPH